jgi:zinc protease
MTGVTCKCGSFARLALMLLVTLPAFLTLPSHAASTSAAVVEHVLANGLRILVKPDHRAPVVVSMLWYRVGSVDEHSGATGLAHVVEHMMFKGTPKVPAGEYAKLISQAGGRFNAFTSRDYTGYFQTLHKDELALALRLEADRMTNLNLDKDEFAREINVVMEERRWRYDDQPRSLTYERLMAVALAAHPYRNPIIGWMTDLKTMTVEDVRAFYEQWYAPNNAILVVVGDVDPQRVFELAQREFGSISRKTLPQTRAQTDPPQLGQRRLVVKAPAEQPYVLMAYRAPGLEDPAKDREPYAMEMLAYVLDGNEAARLNSTLVRHEKIAAAVSASYDGVNRGPAMFYLSGVPVGSTTADELEAALKREVARVAAEGVKEDELERAKAQIIASQVFRRDSMMAQAREIGSLETIGFSHTAMDVIVEKLRGVTAAEVQAVARKYFGDDGLTVAHLDTQPLAGKKPARPPAGLVHGN